MDIKRRLGFLLLARLFVLVDDRGSFALANCRNDPVDFIRVKKAEKGGNADST